MQVGMPLYVNEGMQHQRYMNVIHVADKEGVKYSNFELLRKSLNVESNLISYCNTSHLHDRSSSSYSHFQCPVKNSAEVFKSISREQSYYDCNVSRHSSRPESPVFEDIL